MKKQTMIIIAAIVVIALVIIGAIAINSNKDNENENSIKIETVKDMEAMLNTIYSKLEDQIPGSLEIVEIDSEDQSQVITFTGLALTDEVEKLIVSEPMMSSQAYSAIVVKAKEGADIEKMKQEILDNLNMNKWICVSADKIYVTNYGNIIFAVMADEQWAKLVYDEFKNIVNNEVGKELERTGEEDIDLPPEVFAQ